MRQKPPLKKMDQLDVKILCGGAMVSSRMVRGLVYVLGFMSMLPLVACAPAPQAVVEKVPLIVRAEPATLTEYRDETVLIGDIRPAEEGTVAFQISGRVADVTVEIGNRVAKGQVLARLDPALQQADLQAAEAQQQAMASVFKQASATLTRQQELLKQGSASQSQVEDAQSLAETTSRDLERAQANVENAQQTLALTALTAPHAGVVVRRQADPKQYVEAGQVVVEVVPDGDRLAVFNVAEMLLTQDYQDQELRVALFETPGIEVLATLERFSPTVNAETGTVEIALRISDPPPEMKVGAVVALTVQTQPKSAIALPATSLVSSSGLPAVWKVDQQTSTASLHQVKITSYGSKQIIVASGVAPGEIIVTRGSSLLHPGQQVMVER